MKPPDILHRIDELTQASSQLSMAVRVERLLESAAPGMGNLPAEEVWPQLHDMGVIWWLSYNDFSFEGIAWYTYRCKPGSCDECDWADGCISRDDLGDYFDVDAGDGEEYHYSYELIEAYWDVKNDDLHSGAAGY